MRNRIPALPLIALAVLALPSVLFAVPARAASLAIFESVDAPFVEGPFIFKNQDIAQSFNAMTNYRLVRIEVMVHDLDPSVPVDPLDLVVQTDVGGLPSGTVLATGRADGAFGYNWLTFDLVAPIDLAAGQTYWIVLEDNNDMNQQSGYKWAAKGGNTYAGGVYAIRGGGGAWVTDPTDDLLFRNWGIAGPLVAAGLTVDSPTAGVGDPLTYAVYFSNTGTARASYVWANLTLSVNTTYESDTAAAAGGTALGPTEWQFTDVGVGPHSFLVDVRVNEGVFDGLRIEARLTIDYANEAEVLQERTEAIAVTIARAPSITVAKSVNPRFLGAGENLTYTVTVINSGSRASPWVWVNDTFPPEVLYLGHTASLLANYSGSWWDGTTLHVNFTDLPQGTFAFDINAQARTGLLNGTRLTNTAWVSFADPRGLVVVPPMSATATARIHGASIQVAKIADVSRAGPGEQVRYWIRYDNRGNAAARWVWINDTLPPEVQYVSDTAGGTVSGQDVQFVFAIVSIGVHSLTIVAQVRSGVADGTVAANTVSLSHTDADGTDAPSSTSTATVLIVRPVVRLTAIAPAVVDPGDALDLWINVTNGGNASADGLWINVTTPTDVVLTNSDASSRGGVSTANGWYFADVAPGSFEFRVGFRIVPGVADGTSLAANVTGAYVDGPAVAQTVPIQVSLLVVAPTISLSLTMDRSVVGVSEAVVLTIDYANAGGGVAAHAWLNVTVPTGITVVSASDSWVATTGLRYTWHFVSVLAGGSGQLRVTLRPERDMAPGAVAVSAEIQLTDANGNPRAPTERSLGFTVSNAGWSAGALAFFLLLAAVASLSGFIGYKVYGLGNRDKAEIQQMFLLHKSGLLIKHYTRRLHGSLDTDILAAMIVAVQNFVRESFRFKVGDLEEMKFGGHKILLMHGHYVILAALASGSYLERLKSALKAGVQRVEAQFGAELADWSGVVDDLAGMDAILDQLLRGKMPGNGGKSGKNGGHKGSGTGQ